MNVTCIGSGYVGTVTAAAFAALGHRTTVIDLDERKVELIRAGKSPIFEPGLEQLLPAVAGKTLFASRTYESITEAEVIFICVGTPSRSDGSVDLQYVRSAAEAIGRQLDDSRFRVIVNKSTVPVGTADLVAALAEERSGLVAGEHFAVVSNPEFLREGHALEDVFFPDRIVIGSDSDKAREVMKRLYDGIVQHRYERMRSDFDFLDRRKEKPAYFATDVKSSELIKYASNAFLAVKISYINEIARLSERLGTNVLDVAKGMGMDARIGDQFLQVSSGWGGSCFPKDTLELLATSRQYDSPLSIVEAAIDSNRAMHEFVVQKARNRLKSLNGKRIAVLGLTFKPDTDDVRQSQASLIMKKLTDLGAIVSAHDPKGMQAFERMYPDLEARYSESPEEAVDRADLIILLTDWRAYLELDWSRMYQQARQPIILDTRNALNPDALVRLGFEYEGLGTPR